MARITAFLLILWLMLILQRAVPPDTFAGLRSFSLAVGFALVSATLLGAIAERIRLPRLSGYLLFGLICGPFVINLLTPSMARQLQLVNGLAIALIALIAGLEINISRMRSRLTSILTFAGVTIAVMFAALFAALYALWPWLPLAPAATGLSRVAIAAVVTTLVVSFSPTVTIAVIAESRARGPLSELVMSVVIVADLLLILFFTFAMQLARSTSGPTGAADAVSMLPRLLWDIGGSVAFGAILGSLFALYLRYVGRELTIVLLAVCAMIMGLSSWLHFEALLVALSAGMVVENVAPPEGDALRDAIERGALPVLVLFFVAAGANLHVGALAEIGILAAGVSISRLIAIRFATWIARPVARLAGAPSATAWTGLVSQAGVTFGLAAIVASEFPEWGLKVQTLIIATSAIHVLLGPMLFRAALARLGEVGGLDLMPAPAGSPTTIRTP
jgi:Kef-type K+ transport system membrane component KefB